MKKHLFGISGQEEYLALKQLAKEERKRFWYKYFNNYFKKQARLTEQEKEDLAQGIGEI